MSDESIPEQLRALADGIEAGDFEVSHVSGLRLKVGDDRLTVAGEWVR